MKLLCRCDDSSEAEAIRLRLDAAGILALINGVDSIHVGLEAGPKVEVAEEDFDRAVQILVSDRQKTKQTDPWQCGGCAERNDAAFELCWYCEKPRDDLDQSWDESLPSPTAAAANIELPADDSNPYRPVLLDDDTSSASSQIHTRKRSLTVITVTIGALLILILLAALG